MYKWTIHKWENGQKTEDYSRYLSAPVYYEDRLNEELDTGSITLDSVPTSVNGGKAFPPKTKFRLEAFEDDISKETIDIIVDHDNVEHYEGEPEICCHRIYLIEPSAIAQGMHVDNIALTYELKDVDLNYKTFVTVNETVNVNSASDTSKINSDNYVPNVPIRWDTNLSTQYYQYSNYYYYKWDLEPENETPGKQYLPSLISGKALSGTETVSFEAPRLYCYTTIDRAETMLFELPVKTTISMRKYSKNDEDGEPYGSDIVLYSGPSNYAPYEDEVIIEEWYNPITQQKEPFSQTIIPNKRKRFAILNGTSAGTTQIVKACPDEYVNGNAGQSIVKDIYKDNLEIYGVGDASTRVDISSIASNISRQISFTVDTSALSDDEYIAYSINMEPYVVGNKLVNKYNFVLGVKPNASDKAYVQFSTNSIQSTISQKTYISTTLYRGPEYNVNNNVVHYLKPANSYNAYSMLRKALLTIDTQILNEDKGVDSIEYFIKVEADTKEKLQKTQVYEMTYEQKNLWEVLLSIGHYIHAIPYLRFAEGEDRYVLEFKELGSHNVIDKKALTITEFTNRALSDYYSALDSYMANFFSPQNDITEVVVAKTTDSSYLVSNNTAQIMTSFPILELLSFEIWKDGELKDGVWKEGVWMDATNGVFEKSIYNTLVNTSPENYRPAKGNSLYYEYNTNAITNLQYVAPEVSSGTNKTAFKYLYRDFVDKKVAMNTLKVNEQLFRVRYKTNDDLRVTGFRPDLDKYLKHSSYEKYPHNEQYAGQQDKIVDSERASRKMFGELIRCGNDIFERQEYATIDTMKRSGELVMLEVDGANKPFYVSVCENEYYPDAVFQKVTYSKDFNALSQIVTIPSEPRFFEVATKSVVRREVRLNDFFKLSTTPNESAGNARFLSSWRVKLKNLLFEASQGLLPDYAYTKYIRDKDRIDTLNDLDNENIYPSSKYIIDTQEGVSFPRPRAPKTYADCIVPLQRFPLQNGLVFEWNMYDNFSAGTFINPDISSATTNEDAYVGQSDARYVDWYGRADIFQFGLFTQGPNSWSVEKARALPTTSYDKNGEEVSLVPSTYYAGVNDKYIALDKDNRESLSFNYVISMIMDDNFVTFPNLFGEKNADLTAVLLTREIQRVEQYTGDADVIWGASVTVNYDATTLGNYIKVEFKDLSFGNLDYTIDDVKCIALIDPTTNAIYCARNVGNVANEDKLNPWYIYPVFNN